MILALSAAVLVTAACGHPPAAPASAATATPACAPRASSMQPREWLESAALTYEGGAWRIRFFHSTRVPQE